MFEVLTYEDDQGEKPYSNWLTKLADRQAKSPRASARAPDDQRFTSATASHLPMGLGNCVLTGGRATACITRNPANA